MKTPGDSTSKDGRGSSRAQGKRTTESPRRDKKDESFVPQRRGNSTRVELPPNENIRKHADEVYGDTEIPERKEDI
jgi:hypothetical protein